ncbi:dihydroxy-acid dehydratase [Ancylobacter polymorphus]|uniref:Dihydroxy-acid dehydratase n=1 Tax=Ancylobacter polymorphus TaxID=223390 RepID=A0A9E7D4I8_9HYPH|nr:dihydroxy-acid dehydratase [Ancylobacter polymorphus]UOK71872.1 dihydroxy-acid dehydratase [Ancylobacter polymorphus]
MKAYRSNFERGTTRWAIRRAQWRALGISNEDMEKPKIAVVNTSSELSICFSHLDKVAERVKQGIRDAGGVPFEIRTAAPSDFITGAGLGGRYLMPSRDLMVNDIEVAVEGAVLDGMVCLSSCDKTAPAHLMAAARLDIPSILVIGGYQACGVLHGEKVDIEDVFESVGELGSGHVTAETIEEMCEEAIKSPGVCAGMGTANTMHIISEALGMTMPGSAPVAAGSERMLALAEAAGHRIVKLVDDDIRPSSILTPAAFRNAVTVGLSVSGSINMLRHMQGVAAEGGVDVDVYKIVDEIGPDIPLLCAIKPNGPSRIEDLDAAGGVQTLLRRLAPLLNLEVMTCSGALSDILDTPHAAGSDMATLDKPVKPGPSVIILKGSLAPDGAIMKLGSGRKRVSFRGAACVFESQEDALASLKAGQIRPGDVVVLRGLGARGGPGVASASWFVAAVKGAGLSEDIAVITDGQLSGLNGGFAVGQVMPEAAEGGPLAIVRDGDMIAIDLAGSAIKLEVDSDAIASRLAALDEEERPLKGWLGIYRSLVQPLSRGGTLRPRD